MAIPVSILDTLETQKDERFYRIERLAMLLGSYRDSKGRAKLDDLWRAVIRLRSTVCEMCDAARAMECMHIYPRRHYALRWHPLNGIMGCVPCHRNFDLCSLSGKLAVVLMLDGEASRVNQLQSALLAGDVDTDTVHAELVRRLEKA